MSSTHSIGLGLIGAGRHGIRYARHILQDIPDARLHAVCRQHPAQGLDLSGSESVRMYGSVKELIADPQVQAVIVVTPPILHKEICLAAVAAGKPVLIEKPLATTYQDACTMVEAAVKAGVPLMTAQTLRFDQTIQWLRAAKPTIGRSHHLVLTSRIETKGRDATHADGYGKRGALLEFGVHLLDLVRYVTGEEIRAVRCLMDRLPPAAPETLAMVHLLTDGGTQCAIEVARVAAGRVGRVEWIGSEGQLTADWSNRQLRSIVPAAAGEEQTVPPSQTVLVTIREFLRALEQHRPMPITGEDGCRAVELAEACYRSAEAGGSPVTLPLAS
ncbi:MAG: Gfo/Idh/MocA family oxidoreductase [Nitrospira sp.]|jgi:predicted dehydrogenase|nr:Gfo/Idh/MocA family oxidoreductase [Nitrospira sp.]